MPMKMSPRSCCLRKFPVFKTPAVPALAPGPGEQVRPALEAWASLVDQLVKFLGLARMLPCQAVKGGRQCRVVGIADGAHQDGLVHRADTIAGTDAPLAVSR